MVADRGWAVYVSSASGESRAIYQTDHGPVYISDSQSKNTEYSPAASLILETPAVSSRSLRSAGFSLCASQSLVLQCAFPRTFEDRAVRVYHTVVTLLLAVQHGNLLIVCPS